LPKNVDVSDLIKTIKNRIWKEADLILFIRESEWLVTKYSPYLTDELQHKMHLKSELDLGGALEFIESYRFVTISLTE